MRLHRRSANYREIYPRVSDSGIFGFREWGIIGRVRFKGDNVNGYEIEEPTEEQLAWIMRDIPGEAG